MLQGRRFHGSTPGPADGIQNFTAYPTLHRLLLDLFQLLQLAFEATAGIFVKVKDAGQVAGGVGGLHRKPHQPAQGHGPHHGRAEFPLDLKTGLGKSLRSPFISIQALASITRGDGQPRTICPVARRVFGFYQEGVFPARLQARSSISKVSPQTESISMRWSPSN